MSDYKDILTTPQFQTLPSKNRNLKVMVDIYGNPNVTKLSKFKLKGAKGQSCKLKGAKGQSCTLKGAKDQSCKFKGAKGQSY